MIRYSLKSPLRRFRGIRYSSDEYRSRKSLISNNNTDYYPPLRSVAKADQKLRISDFKLKYATVDFNQWDNKRDPTNINLQGKINNIRKNGKYMYFIDVVQDFQKIQVVASNKMMDIEKQEFADIHQVLRKGDYINCIGNASITNTGELLLKLSQPIQILSPCLNSMVLPDSLSDKKLINSNRVLNYLVSADARERIVVKSTIIHLIRQFLISKQFMEVHTPLINGTSTGANAQPFITKSNYVDQDLQLRVAPELWLKKLVISGFEKIFEIGTSFRNEGIDATHNPEFTTCEFYQSFADLDDLMDLSQLLLKYLYDHLKVEAGTKHLTVLQQTLPSLVALTEPFAKVEFIPTLERETGVKLPEKLTSENLVKYHKTLGLDIPQVKSPAILLDNLSLVYLEPLCHGSFKPMFIYNHPAELSPLSKSAMINYGDRSYDISLRFELFINGKEYINAYEEENSPVDQLHKFQLQQESKDDYNDNEALIPDWNYIKLLEFGLPPTGGWGCGIDRLLMLFTSSERIDQVLPFGNVRDVLKN